jgi:histidine triad (HIT) family protein
MITEEQAEDIKQQLLKQVEGFPLDQRENAKQQILSMNTEQLEEFLIKNKLLGPSNTSNAGKEVGSCIFCSIASGKTESFKIDENEEAIAVLEINPLTNGHTIIIPKKHSSQEEFSQQINSFAEKVSEKLKSVLGAKEIAKSTSVTTDHAVINLIPLYESLEVPKERKPANKEELKKLQEKIIAKPEDKAPQENTKEDEGDKSKIKQKKKSTPIKKLPKAPVRLP